ncbi:HEAT repeat-containing protein 8 [Platysternon megacephalum]|uniref:HEAT repeat-containing protein 8 n=1 Tax=Platysternon megacephalum TaxID=55544 RepID=A0A4D9DXL7_9SAUR|nr:HEAT repeat-containing protein 8 [Platysternon megacephalum]
MGDSGTSTSSSAYSQGASSSSVGSDSPAAEGSLFAGLNVREGRELWCRDGLQDTECLGYRNMARVGEVFGEIFTEGQRTTFLQAALLAIYDPLLRVSQAGLVLAYSILGEAGQLIGDERWNAITACRVNCNRGSFYID